MSNLEYYKIGTDVQSEALRMQNLYNDKGIDASVKDEFELTVTAYTSLSVTDIIGRLDRYADDSVMLSGVLAVYAAEDVGMGIWGEKEFLDPGDQSEVKGINISAWILKQHRAKGFGQELLEHASQQATIWSKSSGLPVWTSIKHDNTASRRACENIGFVEVGTVPNKPERLLYLLS